MRRGNWQWYRGQWKLNKDRSPYQWIIMLDILKKCIATKQAWTRLLGHNPSESLITRQLMQCYRLNSTADTKVTVSGRAGNSWRRKFWQLTFRQTKEIQAQVTTHLNTRLPTLPWPRNSRCSRSEVRVAFSLSARKSSPFLVRAITTSRQRLSLIIPPSNGF